MWPGEDQPGRPPGQAPQRPSGQPPRGPGQQGSGNGPGWPANDPPATAWPGGESGQDTTRRGWNGQGGPGGPRRPGAEGELEQTGAWTPSFDDEDAATTAGAGEGGRRRLDPPTAHSPAPGQPPQAPGRPGAAQAPQGAPPGRPPQSPDRPTDNLPPATGGPAAGAAAGAAVGAAASGAGGAGGAGREPQLLTHQATQGGYNYYSGFEEDPYGDANQDPFEDETRLTDDRDDNFGSAEQFASFDAEDDDELDPLAHRRKIWRRVRRSCYVAVALMFIGPMVAFGVGYMIWDVDSPEQVAAQAAQTIDVKYADNSELTRIVPESGNRTMIQSLNDVSKPMRDATLAAEDATFYQNPGFDVQGILRAALSQISGGGGGGSTLTQQYIKLSTGNDQHTLTRKFKEVVLAFKMSNEQPKDEILKAYLNTAYYGRGAYGVYAAAHAYFGKDPKDINPSEAAVLGGMVQRPTDNDPRIDPEQAQRRWTYVSDQMRNYHFITPEDRAQMRMPVTLDRAAWRGPQVTGSQLHIREQVLAELDREGFDQQTLQQHGFTIVTNIDPRAQKAAEDSVNKIMTGQPENLHPAMVSVDPKSGGVRAYFGGGDKAGGFDYAAAPQPPGSSFKPFVALAGLEQNRGLGEYYDGSSPRTLAGTVFSNNPGVHCDDPLHCTVREAMTKSVNTVFVDMGLQFGEPKVREAAYQAGIPRTYNGQPTLQNADGTIDAGLALGAYPVRTTDMAAAYATFANNGMRNPPRFVSKLIDNSGDVVRDWSVPRAVAAFDPNDAERNQNLAANVTESMLDVAGKSGHPPLSLFDNRPVASKTGTQQWNNTTLNAQAWMVGYTPQIVTAVSLSAGDAQHPVQPIVDASGAAIYGSMEPGRIWQTFMNTYLKGQPIIPFAKAKPIGMYLPPPPPTSSAPPSSSEPPSSSQPPSTTESPSETSETSSSKRTGGGLWGPTATGGNQPTQHCGLFGCSGG